MYKLNHWVKKFGSKIDKPSHWVTFFMTFFNPTAVTVFTVFIIK